MIPYFCSENDDVEIKQNKLKICPYFPRIEPDDQGDMDDELPPSPILGSDYKDMSFKIHSTDKKMTDVERDRDDEAHEEDDYNEDCDAEDEDANKNEK